MRESLLESTVLSLPEAFKARLLGQLDNNDLELPLLPDIVWQVMELSAADDVDARQLATLIHHDQALAGHVLRVANSPAYLPRMPIVSLQQAISRLGATQLCEIVFAISLQSRIFDAPGYEHEIRSLWDHALGAALYAKEIATVRRQQAEGIFLCGLLHDIGKPVILQTLSDLQQRLGWALEPPIATALMDAYHTRVGSRLARHWSLPPQVYESITYHHDYQQAPTHPQEVMTTCLADYLAYHAMLPDIFDAEGVYAHAVLPGLRLEAAHVKELLARREGILVIIAALT